MGTAAFSLSASNTVGMGVGGRGHPTTVAGGGKGKALKWLSFGVTQGLSSGFKMFGVLYYLKLVGKHGLASASSMFSLWSSQ